MTMETDGVDFQGVGEAMDGLIRATAKTGGRLEDVRIDPKAMRADKDELAEALREATNAALLDLRRTIEERLPPAPDQELVLSQMRQLQDRSVGQMRRYLSAIEEAT